jgi:hypothetical protein
MIEPKPAFSRHQRVTLIVTCVGTFMTLLDSRVRDVTKSITVR